MFVSRVQASIERRRKNRNQQQRAKKRGYERVRARAVVPGRRYKITRRCFGRHLYMTPDRPEVREIIGFTLGLCLERYGLRLHAACFMGNHYHIDVTDPHGNYPAFKCMLNSLLAKALNALRGRFDSFWSGDGPCDVELVDDDDVVDRMAYTLANPVTAGLVKAAERWPGFTTAGVTLGTEMSFRRPNVYFDASNPDVPSKVCFKVERPAVRPDLDDAQFDQLLRDKVKERERKARKELKAEGRRPKGEEKVSKQRWNALPETYEPRFTLTPTVAGRSKWARISALQRNRAWEAEYAAARAAQRRGEPAVFPYGTYAELRFRNVAVGPPPH